ncbi:MAG: HAD family hydrolase [Candidatus Aenigmarchaeota archaeon]|nr:HAD family hydrolase [Candidatus Aenigmarchaeota archaeon]
MISFTARIKPNYSEIIDAKESGFESCELCLKKEALLNAGLVIKNAFLAEEKLEEQTKKANILSCFIDDDSLDDSKIKNAEYIAEKLECILVAGAKNPNAKKIKGIMLKNTEDMPLEAIVKDILSNDFDLALDVGALYANNSDFTGGLEILLETYSTRIPIMYISDSTKQKSGLAMGEGTMNFTQVFDIIKKTNYQGNIILDVPKDARNNTLTVFQKHITGDAKSKIKAIFFDADKTLYKIDTTNAYRLLYDFLSKETGIKRDLIKKQHKEEIKKAVKSLDPKKRGYCVPVFEITKDEKITQKAMNIFWDKIIKDLEPYDSVVEVVSEIKKKHNLILVVTSDEFRETLLRKLNSIFGDYTKYFDGIVTPEDTGEMKPSGKYYKIALERFNLKPEEVIVIGDSIERDIVEAKKIGITTVLFKPNKTNTVFENLSDISNPAEEKKEIDDVSNYSAPTFPEFKKIVESVLNK